MSEKSNRRITTFEESMEMANHIGQLALEKKANDVRLLDVHKLTSITDVFIICSGSSDTQVKAIADHIMDEMAPYEKPWHKEGYESREWILLDYVNVVIHIFHDSARQYYDLERLWADAEITVLDDDDAQDDRPESEKPLFDE